MLSYDDRIALQELKAKYCRLLDTKDWDGFGRLFAPDAKLSPVDDLPGVTYEGAAGIRDGVAKALHDVISVHHTHLPEFSRDGADEATGIWAMEDMLWFGESSSAPGMFVHGFGHYRERYRLVQGRWLFQNVELHRLRIETRRS